jgi:hypothetical protein
MGVAREWKYFNGLLFVEVCSYCLLFFQNYRTFDLRDACMARFGVTIVALKTEAGMTAVQAEDEVLVNIN